MNPLLRLRTVLERLRGSLWLIPTMAVLGSLVIATALVQQTGDVGFGDGVLFAGDLDDARGLMQVLAGSTITVTGLVFSLTVVALQIASSQYSPRLVANFLRDRSNKVVLGLFLATFAYAMAVLRSLPSGDSVVVPRLAITVGMLLALSSLLSLVYFINHLTQSIRIETILSKARRSVMQTIDDALPHPARENDPREVPPAAADHSSTVTSDRSGYVQALSLAEIARAAEEADAVVRLRGGVGDAVAVGGTLAWIWGQDEPLSDDAVEELTSTVLRGIEIGEDRIQRQDIAFGLRQIVDVAARALSPGVNDPTTAVDAIGHLAEPLLSLARRHISIRLEVGDEGVIRASAPTPTFSDYLELACGQPRRYGAAEPVVLVALGRLLTDVRTATTMQRRRDAVDEQLAVLRETAERSIPSRHDLDRVLDVLRALEAEQDGAIGRPPSQLR